MEVIKSLVAAAENQDTLFKKMQGSISQQSKDLVSMKDTLEKIYKQQDKESKEEAKRRKREEQNAKRKAADIILGNKTNTKAKKQDKKEGGLGGLGGILGGISGLFGSLFQGVLDKIFNTKGFLKTKVAEIFGPKGFLRKQFGQIFGPKGFLRKQFGQIFGPKGFLRKQLGDSLRDLVNNISNKFKLPTQPDPQVPKPKIPKPSTPIPEAPKPSGNRTSPAANAPGNPRNAKPKTPANVTKKSPVNVIKSLTNPKNIATGLASFGIGIGLDYVEGLIVDKAEKLILKNKLEKYANMSESERVKYKKKREELIQENKDYIEGKGLGGSTAFFADKVTSLGGETSAERIYRLLSAELEAIKAAESATIGNEPLKRARGGPITIPGSAFGDSVPMALPTGSFVLNRTASQFFQKGGLVNTILEPKERVFLPGDPNMGMAMALNEMVPRFGYQKGGSIDNGMLSKQKGASSGKFEYPLPKGRTGTGPAQIFGAPRDGGARKHAGVDLVETPPWGGDPKLPVVAPKDGVVANEKYTTSGYTAGLILKQSDGYDTRYVHMTPEVKPETAVKAGDRIGKLIDLKDQSHLHFELYKSGSNAAMNPTPYLSSAGRTPGAGSTLPGMQPAPDGPSGDETGITNPKKSPMSNIFGMGIGKILGLVLGKDTASTFTSALQSGLKGLDTSLLGYIFPGLGSLFGAPAAAATLDAAPDYISQGSEANIEGDSAKSTANIEGDSAKSTRPYEIAQNMGFSQKDWDVYRNVVGKIESGNTYNPSKDKGGGSGGHYDGRYQLGKAAKIDAASYLGEKFPGHGDPKSAARMAYRRDKDMQERFFAAFTAKNHSYLTGTPEYDSLSVREKFQVLGYAHNQGAGGASQWLKTGKVRRDGFGTAATKYSTELAKAYGSQNTVGMQKGGMVSALLERGETIIPPGDPSMARAMALNEEVPRFQQGGMVGGRPKMSGVKDNQEFKQTNLKKMNQTAASSVPIVIVNNDSGGSQPVIAGGTNPVTVPNLGNLPQNEAWSSYTNVLRRLSV